MRWLIASLIAIGCSAPTAGGLSVTGITPAAGENTKDTSVQIGGGGFLGTFRSNLDEGTTVYDTVLAVSLGGSTLFDATRTGDQQITATVPAGMTPGTYDVSVTVGVQTDTMSAAYTVTPPGTLMPDGGVMPDGSVSGAVGTDAASSGDTNDLFVTNLMFSHVVGTGSNRLLLVGLSISYAGTVAQTVTANGIAMTRVGFFNALSNDGRVEVWSLLAPASGTTQIAIQLSDALSTLVAGAVSYSNVNQTMPLGPLNGGVSNGGNPTYAATTVAGEAEFGVVMWNGGYYSTLTGAQPSAWNRVSADIVGAACTTTAVSPTLSWTVTGGSNDYWALGAITIHPN